MGIVRKVLSDIIINIVEHKYRTRSINETKVGTKPSMTIKYDETGYGYKVTPGVRHHCCCPGTVYPACQRKSRITACQCSRPKINLKVTIF